MHAPKYYSVVCICRKNESELWIAAWICIIDFDVVSAPSNICVLSIDFP